MPFIIVSNTHGEEHYFNVEEGWVNEIEEASHFQLEEYAYACAERWNNTNTCNGWAETRFVDEQNQKT